MAALISPVILHSPTPRTISPLRSTSPTRYAPTLQMPLGMAATATVSLAMAAQGRAVSPGRGQTSSTTVTRLQRSPSPVSHRPGPVLQRSPSPTGAPFPMSFVHSRSGSGPILPVQFSQNNVTSGRSSPQTRYYLGSPRGRYTHLEAQGGLAAAAAMATAAGKAAVQQRSSSPASRHAAAGSVQSPLKGTARINAPSLYSVVNPASTFTWPTSPQPGLRFSTGGSNNIVSPVPTVLSRIESPGPPILSVTPGMEKARQTTPRTKAVGVEPIVSGKSVNDSLAQHMRALQQTKSMVAAQQAACEHHLACRQEILRRETLEALARPQALADALKMWPTPDPNDLSGSLKNCRTRVAGREVCGTQFALVPTPSYSLSSAPPSPPRLSIGSSGFAPAPAPAIPQTDPVEEKELQSDSTKYVSRRTPATSDLDRSADRSAAAANVPTEPACVVDLSSEPLADVVQPAQANQVTCLKVSTKLQSDLEPESSVRQSQSHVVDAGSGATTELMTAAALEEAEDDVVNFPTMCAKENAARPANRGDDQGETSRQSVVNIKESPSLSSRSSTTAAQKRASTLKEVNIAPVTSVNISPRTSTTQAARHSTTSSNSGVRPGSPRKQSSPLRRASRAGLSEETQAEYEKCGQVTSTCVQALAPSALREIRSFNKPPQTVNSVLEATGLLLNVSDIHLAASRRRLFADGFTDILVALDLESITSTQYRRVRKILATLDDDALRTACTAAVPLASWCRAVVSCLAKTRNWSNGGVEEPRHSSVQAPVQQPQQQKQSKTPDSSKKPVHLLVTPDLSNLSDVELSQVCELEVVKPGIGCIAFHGITDCRGMDIQSLVHLDVGEVLVYPDQSKKPKPGHGLNKCATVTMLQCWPPNGRGNLEDAASRDRYRGKIKQMTEQKRARFIDYDCCTGIWKFQVEHF